MKKNFISLLIFSSAILASFLFFTKKADNLNSKTIIDDGLDKPTSIFIHSYAESTEQEKNIAYIDTDNNLIIQSLNTGDYIEKYSLDDKFYEYPKFSPDNQKIMITNNNQILVYDLKTDKKYIVKLKSKDIQYNSHSYQYNWLNIVKLKSKDIQYNSHSYQYNWLNNDKIIYSNLNKTGLNIYDIQKDKTYQIEDNIEYHNILIGKDEKIYTSGYKQIQKDNISHIGIVEKQLQYNEKEDKYQIKSSKTLISAGKYEYMRYSPDLLAISEDKTMLYIIERSSSGSTSTDGVGLGTYNLEDGRHKDFLNMKKWCDDLGKADSEQNQNNKNQINDKKDKTHNNQKNQQEIAGLDLTLKYFENIAISPILKSEIAINSGAGREMHSNKQIVLYSEIFNPDSVQKISSDDLVTQTPAFSNSGMYIYYSGQKENHAKSIKDLNSKDIYKRTDNIYLYDRTTGNNSKLTDKDAGDINPIPLSKDKIAFLRIEEKEDKAKSEVIADLIILSGKNEKTIAKNLRLYLREDLRKAGFSYYGYTSTRAMIDITN